MRLFFLVFSLASTALAGIGIVIVLAAGLEGWEPIVGAAAAGAILAVPVARAASRRISRL